MSGRRAALRIAWRETVRAKGRTALVLCMIGLPVAVLAGLAVLLKTSEWSPREALPYEVGAADARLAGEGHGPVRQDLTGMVTEARGQGRPWTTAEVAQTVTARYGAGARIVPWTRNIPTAVVTPRGARPATGVQIDLRDPLARGLYEVTEGRPPAAADEVALPPDYAGRGFRIGAPVRLFREDRTLRLVGFVRDPRDHTAPIVLTPPGARSAEGATQEWLLAAGRAVTWADVQDLNKAGLTALSRAVVQDPPAGAGPRDTAAEADELRSMLPVYVLAGAMIMLEIVLLAGPAFAVGIRRQRRQLALVAASGGAAPHLRWIVLGTGLAAGTLAAIGGAVLGIGGAAALKPVLELLGDRRLGPLEVPWAPIAGAMLLAVLSGLAAASVPARQAARMDVVAALAGRRETGRARRGWPVAGAVLVGGGMLFSTLASGPLHELGPAAGAAAIIIGCVLAGPAIVGAAGRFAGVLPLPLRLAVRDGARNRGRAAPAVAAIMAVVAGVTVLGIGGASDHAQERLEYRPELPMGSAVLRLPDGPGAARAAEAVIRQELPGVPAVPLRALPGEGSACPAEDAAKCPTVSFSAERADGVRMLSFGPLVGGAREARLLLGRDDPAVSAALAAGKVVLFDARPTATTTATVSVMRDEQPRPVRELPGLPAFAVPQDVHVEALVPPAVARRLGLPVTTAAYGIDRADHRVSPQEEDRLKERFTVLSGANRSDASSVYVERGFTGKVDGTLLLLAAAAAVLALGGSLIATGLSAADARADLATLAAIGARPRTRRLLMMGQAGFIALVGCWLGVAAGLVPGIAVAGPLTADAPDGVPAHGVIVAMPWSLLALIMVGLPLAATLAAGVFTRSRLPLARRAAP
ncbi:ABC transporter permease [Actinomadura macrotermitis]|uniref:ABC3 transporter permease C-terminal domain-containing protein n=1 Tax=Actinomadura macrotermitis TaxID=2585200 RepID=A0A7K0BQX2_9ACTN|nr:ABC transporter permease [Actinomadura macrotermitis]MQY03134.1 hypothetical protein [Actinomadura macrotermitis]